MGGPARSFSAIHSPMHSFPFEFYSLLHSAKVLEKQEKNIKRITTREKLFWGKTTGGNLKQFIKN